MHDCLVRQVPRNALHLADGGAAVLDHADEGKVGLRVDPEPGAGRAAPVVGALGVGLAGGGGVVHVAKSRPKPWPGRMVGSAWGERKLVRISSTVRGASRRTPSSSPSLSSIA